LASKLTFYIDGKPVLKSGSFNKKIIKAVDKKIGKKQKYATGVYDRLENKFYFFVRL
jgi:hypothetical protein